AADADEPTAPAAGPLGSLRRPPFAVATEGQRRVEAGLVVAAVVDGGRRLRRFRADGPRKLVRPDEVPSPDLGRVEIELPRELVDRSLQREDGLGQAGAAIGRRRRLAREDGPDPAGVVPDPVGAG